MNKIKILIAEDNKFQQHIYRIALSDELFDKFIVDNGETALRKYTSWRPDILLLDIMIFGKSGFTVLKEIREDLDDKSTTIIMSTSISEQQCVNDCMKLGIDGYIVKPLNIKEIGYQILYYYKKSKHRT